MERSELADRTEQARGGHERGDAEQQRDAGGDGGGGGGGGTNDDAAQRKVAWTVPEPNSEKEAQTVAMFVTPDKKALVRISGAGMIAYNLSDGKVKWNIGAPDGAEVCSGTRQAPDGVAAIVYGTDGRCTTVATVDVATGKQLWSSNVKVNDSKFPPRYASIAAQEGKIWVSTSERAIRFDAKKSPDDVKPITAAPKSDSYCRLGELVPTEK
ncbi:MAG: PQQ-binding-like beta-propeller repeat protein, partial [Actinophytocola sp.]|nr:PQQ-binding-like beta-propeller repeat protein [Actinophytocola sp.]